MGTTYKREVMTPRGEYVVILNCLFLLTFLEPRLEAELENNVEEYLGPYLHCKYCFLATI